MPPTTDARPGRDIRDLAPVALAWALTGTVAVMAVVYYLPRDGFGFDTHAYWLAGRADHPYGAQAGSPDAFLYSPLFAQVMRPLSVAPFAVFYTGWVLLEAVAFGWLTAPLPLRWRVPVLLVCVPELILGNVYGFLGVAAALGMRRPGFWAFAILTKVTTGAAGVVWFAVRREWRALARLVGWTAVLTGVSVAVEPGLWREWVDFLIRGDDGEPIALRVVRLGAAAVFVAWGAVRDKPWTIGVGMLFLAPHLGVKNKDLAMLAAIPRISVRTATPKPTGSPGHA